MGSFSLNSEKLFLRSAGKSRVMVVKLKKDVDSSVVETKDWEVVEIVGSHMSCEYLDIFGRKIKGQVLKKLAFDLCESRLWVNMEGKSFIRLGITSLSLHVVFYQSNELFDWAQYGVKKTYSNTTDSDDDGKSMEDLKKELKEYKGNLKAKETEIKNNKFDYDKELQKLTTEVHNSKEDYKKKDKELEGEKSKYTQLDEDAKKKDEEIKRLKEYEGKLKAKETEIKNNKIDYDKELKKLTTEVQNSKEDYKKKVKELEGEKSKYTQLDEDAKKKDEEIKKLKGKINSPSTISAVTQYDQILHKWRRPVLSIRFNTVSYNTSLYYSPDLSSMPTYKAVDEIVLNRYPSGINVYVNNNTFQKDHWWFIKLRDENSSYESKFAFYGGVYDSTATSSTTYGGNILVKVPYSSGATVRSNVRFLAVALRGYGTAFGFFY